MIQKKHFVLIVDEDTNFRDILSIKLKSLGFEIAEAPSGKEAIEKLQEIKPDLVLLDVQMPEMDGIETFYQIKNNPKISGVKVVFLTNYGEPLIGAGAADEKFAREAGVIDFIKKNENLDLIAGEVERILSQ